MKGALAELLGVSASSILKAFKKILNLERWPAAEYCDSAGYAAKLDRRLATAVLLKKHLKEHPGLHICGAINRFREVGTEVEKERKRRRPENQPETNPATKSDRKRPRSRDTEEINPPTQKDRKRQRYKEKKETNSLTS